MRILPLSDLHHELWREAAPTIDPTICHPDVVVLAGDIDTGAKAVEWAAQTFSGIPVLYVHGNHESYGKHLDHVQEDIEAACIASGNVHFLNCNELVLDNVRFLGATLWTDFRLFGDDDRQIAMREAEAVMVDYKRIRLARVGYRKLRSADTAKFHSEHKLWLKQKLAEPFAGKTVVVTHMAPSMKSVPERYAQDMVFAAYASNLDEIASQADLWIHGHMHESFDYEIGQCRVVCNPCGYKTRAGTPENAHFDPNLIIELPE
ncbi:metallophosphoesterase [Undibacterium sp. CY18W]|uniref:Metallophosphoesterase n=1 Tax=Undibacterium hunanense TaxID=2762292 RepID=A0ABR6ZW19_9BURK|nr:metallophosphoesterase [Undibacterium hunanense]MBC3920060.1 metallophosphoesterase [Undibacterium hunanense]